MAAIVNIIVNGEPRSISEGLSVIGLLRELGLEGVRVAVERNLAVVPRAEHAETILNDGDRLELVTFVGGG